MSQHRYLVLSTLLKYTFFSVGLLAFVAALMFFSGAQSVQAEPETPEPTLEELSAGLWREGKAVETDWKFLDFLVSDPFRRGYKPTQPIDYSHKTHVEKNNIECQYCHSGVNKSAYATIPSLETCMGCHKQVKTDSPEIKKLMEHWDKKIPVEWEPVNNLPEHVQFNHQRHVKAGFGCQNCHGQVQKMDVVERVSSFKMGFCVSCHRENGASIDCGICHY